MKKHILYFSLLACMAFFGACTTNANEVALIADSCNYPGKLRAYILEYQSTYGNNYAPTNRIIELDTMTIHDKEAGVFYSPDQKVYWTSEPFSINANGIKYND